MICIISAIFPEISSLTARTGVKQVDENIWHMVHQNVLLSATGTGYLESAIQLQSLLHRYPDITQVLFCGSAGVYPGIKTIQPGDLCLCKNTILCDSAAEMDLSLYASLMARNPIQSDFELDSSLYSASVLTTLSLTSNDNLAGTLTTQTSAELENMELYGIASVCRKASIQWNAILGITNKVGKNGHGEWKENYKSLGNITAEYLARLCI